MYGDPNLIHGVEVANIDFGVICLHEGRKKKKTSRGIVDWSAFRYQ